MRPYLLMMPFVLTVACNGGDHAGTNTTPSNRAFPVAAFDSVSAHGPDHVIVRAGSSASVRANGPSNVLDRLDVTVADGALRIARKSGQWIEAGGPATIIVTTPTLRSVALAGSGDLAADRASADEFTASVAGSGDLEVAQLDARKARLSVSGSGDLEVIGTVTSSTLSVTGSGSIDAEKLASESASISTIGSGDIRASARTSADISLLGSGDVTVSGGARCTISKVGSGSVDCGQP